MTPYYQKSKMPYQLKTLKYSSQTAIYNIFVCFALAPLQAVAVVVVIMPAMIHVPLHAKKIVQAYVAMIVKYPAMITVHRDVTVIKIRL